MKTGNPSCKIRKADIVATWCYRETAEEEAFYPQIGTGGSSTLAHSIYLKMPVPFFCSLRAFNPQAHLLFFTNTPNLPRELKRLLMHLDVQTVVLPYTHRPPKDWHPSWRNQFYLFDMLRHLQDLVDDADRLLVCDADCLCTASLEPLFSLIGAAGCALYSHCTDAEEPINGITLKQMEEIYTHCYGTPPTQTLAYYGGEFLGVRGDVLQRICAAFIPLWQANLQLFAAHQPKLNEEAHFLSVLAARLKLQNNFGNRYIKRMWTAPNCHNVCADDLRLPLWHLPYEKKRGLYTLYRYLRKKPDIVHPEAFKALAASVVGVPRKGLKKRLTDRLQTALLKVQHLCNRNIK